MKPKKNNLNTNLCKVYETKIICSIGPKNLQLEIDFNFKSLLTKKINK